MLDAIEPTEISNEPGERGLSLAAAWLGIIGNVIGLMLCLFFLFLILVAVGVV